MNQASRPSVITISFLIAAITALAAAPAKADVDLNDCGGFTEFTRIPGVSTFPDTDTLVYQAAYVVDPAFQTIISGKVPDARYWSFAAVAQTRQEMSALSDYQITVNRDGSYQIVVTDDCSAVQGNCLQVKDPSLNPQTLAFRSGAVPGVPGLIYYRLYVPEPDGTGGVPLPTISYHSVSGTTPTVGDPIAAGTCDSIESQITDLFSPGQPLAALQDDTPPELVTSVCSPSSTPPSTSRGGALGEAQLEELQRDGVPQSVTDLVRTGTTGVGLGATSANAYESVLYSMANGNVQLTAKAPIYRCQHKDPINPGCSKNGKEQVRYWSLCSTQLTRTVDCIRDENVVVDRDGNFTVIIAPQCPVSGYPPQNCLRSGLVASTGSFAAAPFLLYRNTLPAPNFANQYGPVNCPNQSSVFCGPYGLQPSYVSRSCQ